MNCKKEFELMTSERIRERTLDVCSHWNDYYFSLFPSNYGKGLAFLIEDKRQSK
jgi:hypothetical protein